MLDIIHYKKYPLLIFLIIQILGWILFAIHKVQNILPTGNNDFLDYIYAYRGIIEGLSLTISFFLILSLVFRNKLQKTINYHLFFHGSFCMDETRMVFGVFLSHFGMVTEQNCE